MTGLLRIAPAMLLAAALFTPGCGGTGLGGDGIDGIDGSGYASGAIEGFGSIVVAGIHFDVSNASITVDGESAAEDDLRLGMVVLVEGLLENEAGGGVARSVSSADEVEGPVESIDLSGASFVALGQTVFTTEETVFDGTTLGTLERDQVVEVSGFRRADRSVLATRVELVEDIDTFEVTGQIEELDESEETFALAGLRVDYSDALLVAETREGLRNGMLVEVVGGTPLVGDILVADEIVALDEDGPAGDGDDLAMSGVITSVLSPTRFVVNRVQTVRIDEDETILEGGGLEAVAVDAVVDIAGYVADGELVAEIISFPDN